MSDIILQARGIDKQFGGVPVLKGVNLDVKKGEVHALMGENGAGKSTLIKIITGVYTKDDGTISLEGNLVDIHSRADAAEAGISVIYQELSLIQTLTVAQNIFLGQEDTKFRLTKKKEMRQAVKKLIDKYGFDIDPNAEVSSLGMAQRQTVEILKALRQEAKLIIMDEPTSALSASECEKLFETIDELRAKGASILYISHRLEEVYRIADRLTVMRDGENVGVLTKEEITPAVVTKLMIGREVKHEKARRNFTRHEEMTLEVQDLFYKDILKGVNFKAYGGEILGIGGLVGSGRSELISCIYGAAKPSSGTILLNGKPVSRNIGRNMRTGFGLVPEDRRQDGFIPLLPVFKNLALSSYDFLSKLGFVNAKKERTFADDAIKAYDIRPARRDIQTINLSGGNQQKVVLGKWLARAPKLLLLDEPTAGVDVGVKQDLYNYLAQLADTGAIVIMVSSDLPELTLISDRILVLHDGKFFEEFTGEASQADILLAASGEHTERGKAL
jgi:ribose transport system ATP-binding protein